MIDTTKKNYVEFPKGDDYGTNNIFDGFDHSIGVFKGDGLFCWPNRFGKKTFANSSADGDLDLLVICKSEGIEIIRTNDPDVYDKEHIADGRPRFQAPSVQDLVPFVTRFRIEDESYFPTEAGYLIAKLLTPINKVGRNFTESDATRLYYEFQFKFPREFVERARTMPYKDFLQTWFWRVISLEAKRIKRKCEICGSTERLEVHHPDYDFRGEENIYGYKLQVLCHDCHSKTHNKEK